MSDQLQQWYDKVINECINLGICYQGESIAIKPLELKEKDALLLTKDLNLIVDLSRRIIIEHSDLIYPYLRNDHEILVRLFADKVNLPAILRPDGIYVNKQLKIIDLNVDSAIGGLWEVDFLQSLIQENPILNYDKSTYVTPKDALLQFLNTAIQAQCYSNNDNYNLALVGLADQNQFYKDQSHDLCQWITRNTKFTAVYKIPEALDVKDSFLTDGIRNYDVFYRDSTLLHDENKTHAMSELMKKLASSDIKTSILSSPLDLGVEQKAILAILSQAIDDECFIMLNEMEKNVIKKYIPWTRILKDTQVNFKCQKTSLITLLIKNQSDFVIKRCCSHAGEHVFFGESMTHDQWTNMVNKAVNEYEGTWIVQEALKSDQHSFTYYNDIDGIYKKQQPYTFSPFIFGDIFGGALIRIQKNNNQRVLALPTNSEIGTSGVVII